MELEKYIGQVLDNRYKIVKVIGKGGMAIVFEALDLAMKRVVALKVLKDDIAKDPQSVKRFINESKAISMLSHPNIVSIYDISIKGDLKYIVMERVEGITLKNYITRKGALSTREALIYTQQILKALEHAHSKGIIHRDIKPQNIMLLKNGVIKVTDFGIAKLPNAETVTVADKAIGTVYYISPEQASGKTIDQRSDIYSLGIVMYEMLTGDLPFRADTPVSVALKQINEQPKNPREKVPKLAVGVEQIILTAMEKNPDKRFQSAAVMRKHVEQMLANPDYVFSNRKMAAIPAATGIKKIFAKGNGEKKPKVKRQSGSMFPVILGISISFVLVIGICLIMILSELFKDDKQFNEIIVPDLKGKIYSDVLKSELEEQGYIVKLEYTNKSEYKVNEITKQKPEAGSKRKVADGYGCELILTIRRDPTAMTYLLPDYKNTHYRDYQSSLEQLGFKSTVKFEASDSVQKDKIISTDPAPGNELPIGSTVVITVSQGPEVEMIEMPDLVDKKLPDAIKELEKAKLNVGEIIYEESDKEKDTVLWQSWPAGVEISTGNEISIKLSKGPEGPVAPDPVVLDNYVNVPVETVRAALDRLNIRYTTITEYNEDIEAGKVFKTDPVPGTKVIPSIDDYEGTTITLYVSNGSKDAATTPPPESSTPEESTTETPDSSTPEESTSNTPTSESDTTATPTESTSTQTPEQTDPPQTQDTTESVDPSTSQTENNSTPEEP